MSTEQSTSSSSPSSSSHGSRELPHLRLAERPPFTAFSGEEFQLTVFLEVPSSSPQPAKIKGRIELTASLLHSSSKREVDSSQYTLTVNPTRISIDCETDEQQGRRATFTCAIQSNLTSSQSTTNNNSSSNSNDCKFQIRLALRKDVGQALQGIAPLLGAPIHLVRYKPCIEAIGEWEDVWFNAEGGKDKGIEVEVSFRDRNNQKLLGTKMPIIPTLHYADNREGSPVVGKEKDVFQLMGQSKPRINMRTGECRVKFRVNEVSRTHRSKSFVVKFAPGPNVRGAQDIGFGFTRPVEVRSKQSKQKQNKQNERKRKGQPVSAHAAAASIQGSPTARQRTSYEAQAPMMAAGFPAGVDTQQLQEAMTEVLGWTGEAVAVLDNIRWRVIGYNRKPDGTSNYQEPYHDMPNPNRFIDALVDAYKSRVRPSLNVLKDAVDQTNPIWAEGRYPNVPTAPSAASDTNRHYDVMHPPGARNQTASVGVPLAMDAAGMQQQQQQQQQHPHQPLPTDHFANKREQLTYRRSLAEPMQQGPQMHQVPFGIPPQQLPIEDSGSAAYIQQASQPPRGVDRPMGEYMMNRESETDMVYYILSMQYKVVRTGEHLGVPGYNASKRLLGFFRRSSPDATSPRFVTLDQLSHGLEDIDMIQATQILQGAIDTKSTALFSLGDFATIGNMIDHAFVADFLRDEDPPRAAR